MHGAPRHRARRAGCVGRRVWSRPDTGINWPPFRIFGEDYYTYQLLRDLQVADDFAVRTEPHPRVFSSSIDDIPIAALLRTNWWPMIPFVVLKVAPEGGTHVFRRGESFKQMIFAPAEPEFELVPMTEAGSYDSHETLAKDSTWTYSTRTIFDDTYRNIFRAARDKAKSDKAGS